MTIENKAGEISPIALKAKMDSGADITLLDVREPHELLIATIKAPQSLHISMKELADKLSDLKDYKDRELIVYCRSGGRSARCSDFLQNQGFKKVFNLTGGILSWTDDVDPTLIKY